MDAWGTAQIYACTHAEPVPPCDRPAECNRWREGKQLRLNCSEEQERKSRGERKALGDTILQIWSGRAFLSTMAPAMDVSGLTTLDVCRIGDMDVCRCGFKEVNSHNMVSWMFPHAEGATNPSAMTMRP